MKKITLLKVCAFACVLFASFNVFSQTSEVIVSVNWPSWSTECKVEIYSPSNATPILTIDNGYNGTADNSYNPTPINLGCLLNNLTIGSGGYYAKVYELYGDGWNGGGTLNITSGGINVLSFDENSVSDSDDLDNGATGEETQIIYFAVANGGGTCSSDPEINISGSGYVISDNDTSPSVSDGTDFGSIFYTTGTITKTFTIQNLGSAALTLGGPSPYVTISGADASNFTISSAPSNSISSGGSTSFDVTFDPVSVGTKTVSLSISNNDTTGSEDPYNFDITATSLSTQGLHAEPACGENFTLDWSSAPVASNEFDWAPDGSLSNSFTDVDGSGIDMSIAFTGDTSSLGVWSTQTPSVGNNSSTLYEGLDLITNGLTATGITCTITFSSPIYALSFDMHHVNTTGASGDKYTISATTANGDTIFPTFTNSASPSYTTNDATGMIDATGISVAGTDALVGVNFSDDDYITSVTFLWQDCTTCSIGNVHGSGLGNFSFCIPQTLDFDGVNDYISRAPFLGNKSEATMMTWIKLDDSFNGGYIMGQRNFYLRIDSDFGLKAFAKSDSGATTQALTPNARAPKLSPNMWYHVAAIYNGSEGSLELFLNGDSEWKTTSLDGTVLNNTDAWNADHDFEIGRNTANNGNYFEGDIYESRVYSKALTADQLRKQINQEIENNSGNVRGTVIPKDIEGLAWSDLELYYKMESINTGYTPDASSVEVNGRLNNMRTYQERTAPMPYVTKPGGTGDWNDANNWLHGDVWDITNNHPDCAIVQLTEDMHVDEDHTTIGLIIEDGNELVVNNDSGLINTWYLKLDGEIDLDGESQLVQTDGSDLAVGSNGKIYKNQQGTADKYTYNYWSSPVGVNDLETNEYEYTLPQVIPGINYITSGYDGTASPVGVADYWIWKFANQADDDYSAWQHVGSTGTLKAGEGFTMKGPGTGDITDSQNYEFSGKPNNGDIALPITAGNDYLVGNPYASAIDAEQFILDNGPTVAGAGNTTGTLYFWEHWGGGSHNLEEYQGGYATYNLIGGVPAVAKGTADPDVDQSSLVGTKTPGRYIPVSQGFFVIGEATGTIKFNNGQRVFQKEGSNSVFMEADNSSNTDKSATKSSENEDEVDSRMKLRVALNSNGLLHRQLLVGADTNATEGIDWGYDGQLYDDQTDDIYWMIEDAKYVIQGINEITEQTVLPLGIHTNLDGLNTITLEGLENFSDDVEVYIHDKDLELYHDLRSGDYEFELTSGTYLERFEITFAPGETLDVTENEFSTFDVNYTNDIESIIIINPANKEIESLELFNMLGQSVFFTDELTNATNQDFKVAGLSTGTYIITIETPEGKLSKKVLIK